MWILTSLRDSAAQGSAGHGSHVTGGWGGKSASKPRCLFWSIPPTPEFTVMSKGSDAWRPFATGPLIPSAWALLADGLNLLFSLSPGGQQTGRGLLGRPKVPGGQARPQEANLPHKRFCKSQVATGLTNKILTAITHGTYRNVPSTYAKYPTGLTLFKIALTGAGSHHSHFTDRQTEARSPLGKDSQGLFL